MSTLHSPSRAVTLLRSLSAADRGITVLCCGLLMLSVAGCEIQTPALPTFTTTVTVPIGEERIEMAEVIADQEFLRCDEDGALSFALTGDPHRIGLEMDLTAEIAGADIDVDVGNYSLDVADSTHFGFTLAEMYPPAVGLNGRTIAVPPFVFDLGSATEAFTGLVSADVASGQLVVTVTNSLSVAVSGPAPPEMLQVALLNAANGAIITELDFPRLILPDSQATVTADLTDSVLTGEVAVQLRGGSTGSAEPVTIDAAASMLVDAWLRDLTVRDAIAVIQPQTFASDYTTDLPDTIRVVEAEITAGLMTFDLANGLPIPCVAELYWHEVLDTAGQPLVVTYALAALSSQRHSLDLAGMRIFSTDGSPLATLGVTATVTSPGSGDQPVHLQATDHLQATTSPVALNLGAVTGSIPEQTFGFEPLVEQCDLPEEVANVALTAASLVIRVDNASGMPAQVLATLTGTAADSSKATMEVAAAILPAPADGTQETLVVVDQTNSDIVPFLNHQPETIAIEGEVILGGETVIGTVRPGDFAIVSWEISAPLEVIFTETIISSAPDDLDLGEDTKELIRDHAVGARVVTEVTNHMPFAADITVYVSDDTTTIASAPLLSLQLQDVAAGQLDPALHTVTAPVISHPTLELTRDQMQVFGLPERALFTVLEVTLPGSDGPVCLNANDYIQVRGLVSLEVLIEE